MKNEEQSQAKNNLSARGCDLIMKAAIGEAIYSDFKRDLSGFNGMNARLSGHSYGLSICGLLLGSEMTSKDEQSGKSPQQKKNKLNVKYEVKKRIKSGVLVF